MFAFNPQPDEDEAAAVLAAIALCLASEAAEAAPAAASVARARWHESRQLALVGLCPQRLAVAPRWGTIERLRRASGG